MHIGRLNSVSNRADYIDCVAVIDTETDEPIDLSTVQEIVVQLAYPQMGGGNPSYGSYASGYNWSGARASLSGGTIQHVQTGIFQFHIAAGLMAALPQQDYHLGVGLVAEDGTKIQLIIGDVSVMEGYINMAATPV